MQTVSAIIPVFNRRHTLGRAIDSILAQSRQVDEIIVVDDGSTDGVAGWISAAYPEVRLIVQANRGVSAARNAGIQAATGDWIALLDSDDEWLPEKIQRQLEMLQLSPDGYRLCHTDEIWIRDGKRVNPMRKHEKAGGSIFQRCLPMCVISPSSALLHQSIFEQPGLFDETLPACEDYDMWLRICAREPVLYVNEPLLVKYGGHEDQLSRQYWGMDRFRVQALNKLLNSGVLDAEQQDQVKMQIISMLEVLINGARKRNKAEDLASYQLLMGNMKNNAGNTYA